MTNQRDRALALVAQAAGSPLRRVKPREQSYVTPGGTIVHVGTSAAHGTAPTKYWFGVSLDKWQPGHFFVLSCGSDFHLVIPVSDLIPYRDRFPADKSGARMHLHIAWDGAADHEISDIGVDAARWVDAFDLLK
jgi:hypothetical protein